MARKPTGRPPGRPRKLLPPGFQPAPAAPALTLIRPILPPSEGKRPPPTSSSPLVTEEVALEIIQDVSVGVSPAMAARRRGIGVAEWSAWKRLDSSWGILERIHRAEADFGAAVEMSVAEGSKKDPRLAILLLKRRFWVEGFEESGGGAESPDVLSRMETRLAEMGRLRTSATLDSSFVAAGSLLAQEMELIDRIQALREKRDEDARLHALRVSGDMDGARQKIREMIQSMPEPLVATIRDALADRSGKSAAG